MTAAVLGSAGLGLGIWLLVTGLLPEREPLASSLARLGRAAPTPVKGQGFEGRVGSWMVRQPTLGQLLDGLATDLRMLRKTREELAAELLLYGLLGAFFVPFVAAGGLLMGIDIPLLVPLWLSIAGAAIAVVIPYRAVRSNATEARAGFGHALSAFCDVAGMSMSAGREVYAALFEAAAAGDGPAFRELRDATQTALVSGDKPWDALRALGTELGVDDLVELGATLALAGDEGAAVRDTVASRARSIRERLIADAEKHASSATERMAVPGAMLMIGFLWFLTFPALELILHQAH
jgi:Flp pilus assembly protein TadB